MKSGMLWELINAVHAANDGVVELSEELWSELYWFHWQGGPAAGPRGGAALKLNTAKGVLEFVRKKPVCKACGQVKP